MRDLSDGFILLRPTSIDDRRLIVIVFRYCYVREVGSLNNVRFVVY